MVSKLVIIAAMMWAALIYPAHGRKTSLTPTEAHQRVFVPCSQIRQSVATYGLLAVEQFAREHGVPESDLRRARLKCLRG